MNWITGTTPFQTPCPNGGAPRAVLGVVLHHTGGPSAVNPHSEGSWHILIDRNGDVYQPIPFASIAWHCANTNRWTPDWVTRTAGWFGGSSINTCTIGIELVSVAGTSLFTDAQYESFQGVASRIVAFAGHDIWWVGHGEVQPDRRLTEPDNFDWARAGFGDRDSRNGRRWMNKEQDVNQQEQAIIQAIRDANYSDYALDLIKVSSALSMNAGSIAEQVEKIGALESIISAQAGEIEELKGRIAGEAEVMAPELLAPPPEELIVHAS